MWLYSIFKKKKQNSEKLLRCGIWGLEISQSHTVSKWLNSVLNSSHLTCLLQDHPTDILSCLLTDGAYKSLYWWDSKEWYLPLFLLPPLRSQGKKPPSIQSKDLRKSSDCHSFRIFSALQVSPFSFWLYHQTLVLPHQHMLGFSVLASLFSLDMYPCSVTAINGLSSHNPLWSVIMPSTPIPALKFLPYLARNKGGKGKVAMNGSESKR